MAKWEVSGSGGFLLKDGEVMADRSGKWNSQHDFEEIALKLNVFDEMLRALREYQDHGNWHWNGEAWEWNGERSANFLGDPNEGNGYPSQDRVDAECGAIAKDAIAKAEGER